MCCMWSDCPRCVFVLYRALEKEKARIKAEEEANRRQV